MSTAPPRVFVVTGAQEFFADRLMSEVAARHRGQGAELREIIAADGVMAELLSAASPDLFGGSPVILLRGFETFDESDGMAVLDLVESSDPTGWIIHHAGGRGSTKVRTRLEKLADASAKAEQIKGRGVTDFVQKEFRSHAKTADPATIALLIEAIGADPRGLASAVAQLSSDIEQTHIGRAEAEQYYSGHVEVKGYEIADAVAERDAVRAMAALRFALHEGGTRAGLMTVAALSTTLRRIAVAKAARPGHQAADVAGALRIPEWMARSAVAQARMWSSDEIADAIAQLSEMSVVMKGGYEADGALTDEQKVYVLERAVMRMATPTV